MAAYVASAAKSYADHHVVSADPLEVEYDLGSANSTYTPVNDFYIRDHFPEPVSTARAIEITGAVERPFMLDDRHLAAMKLVELGAVLECAGNPVSIEALVSNGLWGGWHLGDVVALAHPQKGSTHILLYGRDGYRRAVPMSRLSEGAMLVSHLNGLPLRRNHGSPWRAFFPGWYGMDSVKWLEKIVVSTEPPADTSYSYHQLTRTASGVQREPLPRIKAKSIIISPRPRAYVHPGNVTINGLAWSGSGKIQRIELSPNGGREWQTVVFSNRPQYEWVMWSKTIELKERGARELVLRAVDESGQSQPERPDPARIDRYANNWLHRVLVTVI